MINWIESTLFFFRRRTCPDWLLIVIAVGAAVLGWLLKAMG